MWKFADWVWYLQGCAGYPRWSCGDETDKCIWLGRGIRRDYEVWDSTRWLGTHRMWDRNQSRNRRNTSRHSTQYTKEPRISMHTSLKKGFRCFVRKVFYRILLRINGCGRTMENHFESICWWNRSMGLLILAICQYSRLRRPIHVLSVFPTRSQLECYIQ